MERPYVPFYKPYGMTDEEYEYEVRQAEQRLAEWEAENEALQQADVSCSLPLTDAIEFADWIADNGYGRTSMGVWRSNDLGYTTEKLYEKFQQERRGNDR